MSTVRLSSGAATCLLMVLMPWLSVAAMYSLLVLPLVGVALLTLAIYVALTVQSPGGRNPGRAFGALLLVAGIVATEWSALMTADRLAKRLLAASRGHGSPLPLAEPVAAALLGVALFLVGGELLARSGSALSRWETAVLAVVPAAAGALVWLVPLPLTA